MIKEGRRRVVIENVTPCVDGGRFPAKRCAGDRVQVEADIFTDGHDVLRALLLHRPYGESAWTEVEMTSLPNDHWRATFDVPDVGVYEFSVTAWTDKFATWRHELPRWTEGPDIESALRVGAGIVADMARRARGADGTKLLDWKARLLAPGDPIARRIAALDDELAALGKRYADRRYASASKPVLRVAVEPRLAGFSAWYEMFPRSAGDGTRHGTFADVEALLPYVADMGFDVLYLPPIHPIGTTKRKGRNNALVAAPGEPGSPWAIGSPSGGHKSIHPELGSEAEFRQLVEAARSQRIEVALDIAFQTSPDHPYVADHPQWFGHRPDGTIRFAENPPKKYEDIYPFDFESADWQALWQELLSIFTHWIDVGVRVFRVDNPHTKPFAMWEWLIGEVKAQHPEVLFLSEAFTRPHPMHWLAKVGFSQSYTYFAWRNTKEELTEYFTELSKDPSREYLRPNVWPNTPDILTEYLQSGLRPAFVVRLVLAGTLSANYGIYGPAFELMEHLPRSKGSEEYLNSEKYEIKAWDRDREDSLRPIVARLNAIRRTNPALHANERLAFHEVDNEHIIGYSKSTDGYGNVILAFVNLDPRSTQWGWTSLDLPELGIEDDDEPFEVHDLLTDARYQWKGRRNFVELRPGEMPAHVFLVRRVEQA
jgi:starch synthase (maltosyl-transferring)